LRGVALGDTIRAGMGLLGTIGREIRTIAILARVKRRVESVTLDGPDTVADVIEGVVDDHRDATALRFEGESWSYRDLEIAANRVAHWAHAQGLGRGDVVALLMENRPEYLFTWIGLAKAGVETALLNTNLTGSPLAHAITVCEGKTIIVGAELVAAYESARSELAGSLSAWVWRDTRAAAAGQVYQDLDAALATFPDTRPPRTWRASAKTDDNLFFIYTSGTTGLPKAARFSHYRYLQAGLAFSAFAGVRDTDVIYCCLPLYHTAGGVLAVAMAFLSGATLVLRRRFSATAFWDDCRAYDVTVFQYIGELCRYLVNRPESASDRDHRVRCAVGNGLRPDIWARFQKRFAIRDIREFYGATEGNFAMVNIDNKVGSVGRVPPYIKSLFPVDLIRFDVETETHLRGADGFCIRCRDREVGEAIGRIPADRKEAMGHFEGYTDETATKKKVLHDVFEKGDAWYRTGDLMSRDADGYYYFVDRIGDTFRWKGENVATSEVAEVLSAFDDVIEANVYGVRVPGAEGRAGMAALVAGRGFDLQAFYGYVSSRIPSYARPLFLRMRASMDTTGTFKHRKVDLVREGFDPVVVEDPLYMRDDDARTYVPLDVDLHRRIIAGELAL